MKVVNIYITRLIGTSMKLRINLIKTNSSNFVKHYYLLVQLSELGVGTVISETGLVKLAVKNID